MQAIDRDELLGKVKRRSKVIDSAMDMIRIAQIPEVGLPRIRPGENRFARIHVVTQPENPPPRRQHRIPLRCSSGILRRLEVVGDDTPERSCREILLPEKTLP